MLPIIGTNVRLTKRDAATAATMTTVREEKNTPTRPDIKARGRRTTTVVRVDAVMADWTSAVPITLATDFFAPFSR